MDHRENLLRCVRFERPDVIPMVFLINPACWQHYPHDALQELMERHPMLFPGFRAAASYTPEFSLVQRAGAPYRDPWGCVWRTSEDGITGVVTEHPLADWAAFEGYEAPDPERTDGLAPVDWDAVRAGLARDRAAGRLPQASLRHGHTFLQLSDLRGYQAAWEVRKPDGALVAEGKAALPVIGAPARVEGSWAAAGDTVLELRIRVMRPTGFEAASTRISSKGDN